MKFKVILTLCAMIAAFAIITSCNDEAGLNFKRYYSTGQSVYQTHCQNCHGANGEGLGALIPPLTDSSYLRKNLHALPCLIRDGIKDTITINGKIYTQAMPPQADLSPIKISEVLTYVGNSFGNKMGLLDAECK